MEEATTCDVNHLDADVRLPPRKRLLAGLRRQSSDCPPSPLSILAIINRDMSDRLRNLFNSYSNLSSEELVEASKSAALTAAQVAADAKAVAEEKAAKAAKATAFAKGALEFVVASVKNHRKESHVRRGRPKKHVPVNLLYKKRKLVKKCESDEELARRLHRAMNSSSRLSNKPTSSSLKLHNYKKLRKRLAMGKTRVARGGLPWEIPFSYDKNAEADDMVLGEALIKLGKKTAEHTEIDSSEVNGFPANGTAEVYLKVRALEDKMRTARKRGRIKQKKLSLSLCTIRDRENSKEEPESRSLKVSKGECTTANVSTFAVIPAAEDEGEAVSTWKFKDLNAPQCYTGSNILGSLCANPTVTTGSAMVQVDQ